MHYYIDGYNLIFRLMHKGENLQDLRENVIQQINAKASLTHLNVSIVFDAPLKVGEGTRSHYDAIEILYTAEGETADEFLLSELRSCPNPHLETLVTSDKKLAWRARHKSAHTMSVEEFIDFLNRRYKNKLSQIRKPQPTLRSPPKPSIQAAPQAKEPDPKASAEACVDFYEQAFQANFEKILQEEEARKPAPEAPKRKPKQPRKSLFPTDEIKKEDDSSAMERWQKIFEHRIKNEDEG